MEDLLLKIHIISARSENSLSQAVNKWLSEKSKYFKYFKLHYQHSLAASTSYLTSEYSVMIEFRIDKMDSNHFENEVKKS